tara:strand:- start:402 stop:587 length:186 start_codon:yes stop_codon:yes gene_type:complete
MSNGQTHGGKGSATRPTDTQKYADNYDAIFGKKKKEKKEEVYNAVNEVLKEAKLKEMQDES